MSHDVYANTPSIVSDESTRFFAISSAILDMARLVCICLRPGFRYTIPIMSLCLCVHSQCPKLMTSIYSFN